MKSTASNYYGPVVARLIAWATLALTLTLFQPERALAQWTSNGNDLHTTNSASNVGIGISSPQATLHLQRNTNGDVGLYLLNSGSGTNSRSIFLLGEEASNARYGYMAYLGAAHPTTPNSMLFTNAGAGGLRFLSFGGPSHAGGFITFGTAPTAILGGNEAIAERMRIDASGNVGIGTTAPGERLQISSGHAWSDAANGMLMLGPNREVSLQRDPRPGLENVAWLESNAYLDGAGNWHLRNTASGGALIGVRPSLVDVWTTSAGSPSWVQQFSVDSSQAYFRGNVGIGTTAPAERLQVEGNASINGNVTVSGNIAARYQDIAEWVAAREGALPPGTVVVLDPEQTNQVMASARAYDTSVAGVVSAQPGLILGEAGAGRVMVATTGRVRVRVDATRAPIRVGDLLVTSDTPGVAMRSVPLDLGGTPIHRPGTLIGKALEPLTSGTGEILVLLSLQ